MKVLEIYTDGSSKGNPGPSGWAYLLKWGDTEKLESGYLGITTNNRAELTALINALKAIKRPVSKAIIYSDSEYVVNGIKKWLPSWKSKNFRDVKNPDLWKVLDKLLEDKLVSYEIYHVRAHQGHRENEIVDKAAQKAADSRGN